MAKVRFELQFPPSDFKDKTMDILLSSLTEECKEDFRTVKDVIVWLKSIFQETVCDVELIPLKKIKKWFFDEYLNIRHESGKFFSIVGIRVRTNMGVLPEWSQPIIEQPEIGLLGILCQKRRGVLKFLMQAKIEPGNINRVQISPTVQATKSNYTQVHKGDRPLFVKYFFEVGRRKIIVDQLQSEQGARFLRKRNRNTIIELDEDECISVPSNFCWLTLGQLKALMRYDNIVNMDARTVISCISLPCTTLTSRFLRGMNIDEGNARCDLMAATFCQEDPLNSFDEIMSWFTVLRMKTELDVVKCNINELGQWQVKEYNISHIEKKYFRVIGAEISIGNREVKNWCQPLVQQVEKGIVGFIIRKIGNVYHILVQAKLEAGNFDMLEMAPTVQCITGSYCKPEYRVPYLEYFVEKRKGKVLYDCLQSEEGGRFFHEQNRYVVLEVGDEFPIDVEEAYIWMTLWQAKEFIKFNNYFNVEARSLIACFSPI